MDRQKLARYNIIAMITEGTLFWAGLAFIESTTVVSLFVDWQTGSTVLVGLAASLRTVAFLFGQLISGSFIAGLKDQRKFMVMLGYIGRPLLIIMMIAMLMGASGPIAAYLLIGLISLWFFLDGLVALCWLEIMVRTVPHAQRGKIFGYQQALSGAVGILIGFVLRAIYNSDLTKPEQFTLIFTLATVFMIINAFVLAAIKDDPEKHPQPTEHISVNASLNYFKRLIPMVGESRAFQRLTIARGLYALIALAAPLYILKADALPNVSPLLASYMFFMPVIGQMVGGIFWAWISAKVGYVPVMYGAQLGGIIIGVFGVLSLVLPGNAALICLMLALLLVSANNGAYMGYFNHLVEKVPDASRTSYVVLTGVFMAPLAFATTIAGYLCGRIGYAPVFATAGIVGTLGLLVLLDSRRKGII